VTKIRSSDEIYEILERTLSKSSNMMTCAELMDTPEVKAAALERFGKDVQIATNKFSDTLGFMWRRGVIDRFPTPASQSMARYAYALKNKIVEKEPIRYDVTLPKLGKYALSITERDVVLDFNQSTIIVRPK